MLYKFQTDKCNRVSTFMKINENNEAIKIDVKIYDQHKASHCSCHMLQFKIYVEAKQIAFCCCKTYPKTSTRKKNTWHQMSLKK